MHRLETSVRHLLRDLAQGDPDELRHRLRVGSRAVPPATSHAEQDIIRPVFGCTRSPNCATETTTRRVPSHVSPTAVSSRGSPGSAALAENCRDGLLGVTSQRVR